MDEIRKLMEALEREGGLATDTRLAQLTGIKPDRVQHWMNHQTSMGRVGRERLKGHRGSDAGAEYQLIPAGRRWLDQKQGE